MRLDLSYKNLKSLLEIDINDDVTKLDCRGNQITSLIGVNFPPKLDEIVCSGNQLTSLSNVNFPENLKKLYCYDNQITSLVGVNFPPNLKVLSCSGNQFTSFVGVNFPPSLKYLDCRNNQMTKITNLPSGLKGLLYDHHDIEYIDDVKMSDINFTLKGYQAIRRIQKRMKRRYKEKDRASRVIGLQTLKWLHSELNGSMFKRELART